MNQLLDWAQGRIENLPDHVKCEFAVLASLVDPDHVVVQEMEFSSRTYETIASWLLPNAGFTRYHSSEFTRHRPEFVYILHFEGSLLPEFVELDLSNPLLMVHQLFFATNFGTTIFNEDEEARALVYSELENDPWNGVYTRDYLLREWWGELLMALLCMGEPVEQQKLNFVMTLENEYTNINESNYHAFMVMEILKAMIARAN